MAQAQVDILRSKLELVKSKSETLLGNLSSVIDKEADDVANGEDLNCMIFDEIITILDTVLEFLVIKNDDMHKISKLTSRIDDLEMAMSTCLNQVESKTNQLLLVQDDQQNTISTIGETLNSLVSFELDNFAAKMQEMVYNWYTKTEQHSKEIDALKTQLQEIQEQSPHVFSLQKNLLEVMSRLYSLEDVTNRFIKSHETVLPQLSVLKDTTDRFMKSHEKVLPQLSMLQNTTDQLLISQDRVPPQPFSTSLCFI